MSSVAARTRKEATRGAILTAALQRFTHYGYRRTSMDDLAGAAGISRAAVYLHFKNKEDVFRALSEELQNAHLERAEEIAGEQAPIADRLRRVLREKLGVFTEIVAGSPHGAELLDENSRVCGDISLAAHRRFVRLIAGMVAEADATGDLSLDRAGVKPAVAAELAYDWLRGVECAGLSAAASQRRMDQAALLLVIGLGGTAE